MVIDWRLPLVNSLEPLFECNGEIYHGYRKIIYDQIECFREIKDIVSFSPIPVLNSMAPKYLINMWIRSMYGNQSKITFGQHSFRSMILNNSCIWLNTIRQYQSIPGDWTLRSWNTLILIQNLTSMRQRINGSENIVKEIRWNICMCIYIMYLENGSKRFHSINKK